jgi:hypothetical protein
MIVHVLSSAGQLAPSISTKCNACNKPSIQGTHYTLYMYVCIYVHSSLLALQEHCTRYRYSSCLIQPSFASQKNITIGILQVPEI